MTRSIRSIVAKASAKVNLAWSVGGRRADGYHDVVGLMQTISLADHLTISCSDDPVPDGAAGVPSLHLDEDAPLWVDLTGPESDGVPGGPDNLVCAAARVMAERIAPKPTLVRIHKAIPAAAGLGGGSADAAAVLTALPLLWSARLRAAELADLGARIGSDVPALLAGGLVHASGRGELIRRVGSATGTWFVLGIAPSRLSTADVYAHLARLRRGGLPSEAPRLLRNDLQDAAVDLDAGLRDRLDAMRDAGAAAAFVSGSGPTVVGICAGAAEAGAVASAAAAAFRRVEVCRGVPSGVHLAPRRRDD